MYDFRPTLGTILQRVFVGIPLTVGALGTVGVLSFAGMYALTPSVILATFSSAFAVIVEGEVYSQNIFSALKKLFNPYRFMTEEIHKQSLQQLADNHHKNKADPNDNNKTILDDYLALQTHLEKLRHGHFYGDRKDKLKEINRTVNELNRIHHLFQTWTKKRATNAKKSRTTTTSKETTSKGASKQSQQSKRSSSMPEDKPANDSHLAQSSSSQGLPSQVLTKKQARQHIFQQFDQAAHTLISSNNCDQNTKQHAHPQPSSPSQNLTPLKSAQQYAQKINRSINRKSWILVSSLPVVALGGVQSTLVTASQLTAHLPIITHSLPWLVMGSTTLASVVWPLAVVAGIAYSLLIFRTFRDIITNDKVHDFFKKIKACFPKKNEPWHKKILMGTGITLGVGLLASLVIGATVLTAGTWWTYAQQGVKLLTPCYKIALGISSGLLLFSTTGQFMFFAHNNAESTSLTLSTIQSTLTKIKKLWQNFKTSNGGHLVAISTITCYGFKKLGQHLISNPFRLATNVLDFTWQAVIFVCHVISIGVTGDKFPYLPPALSASICALNDALVDLHYIAEKSEFVDDESTDDHHSEPDDHHSEPANTQATQQNSQQPYDHAQANQHSHHEHDHDDHDHTHYIMDFISLGMKFMPPFALLYVASGLWHYTASHVNNQTSSVTLLKAMAWAFNLNGHNKEALPQHPELTQNFKRYNCYWDYQLMGDANRKLIETPTANSQSQASNDNQVDNDQPSAAAKTKTTNEAQNEGVMHWCQNKLACKLSVFNHKYAMDSQTYQNVYEEFLNSQPQN